MNDNFLHEFLKTGLFDIGEADERLAWLKKAIADLQKKFEEDNSLLPAYTLVALDPNVPESEPVLVETEKMIIKHWESLRVRFPNMPINIIRGVILNALSNVGNADAYAARIIYLAGTNFYNYAKLNNEKQLVENLLIQFGANAEADAVDEWSLVEEEPALKLGTLKVSDFKFNAVEINKASLKASLKAAVQNEPNGHGTQHGGNSAWGEHFANKSSEGIAQAFQTALDEFNKSLSPTAIETPINKFFTEFKKSLDINLKNAFSSLTAVERRSKLLWWKETLYSPSQKTSYRGMDQNTLPIIMACDLNDQVPEITPVSVDYLLRDTLFLLSDRQEITISFNDFLIAISQSQAKAILKPYFTHITEIEGRISITDFIALLVNDRTTPNNFKQLTGIEKEAEIKLSDLSVVVLHDLLIQRLIAE